MSKYMRTVICLVLLATATLPMATQDAAICEALRAIHATHGDSLAAYLSEKGEDCLEPAEAQTPEQSPTVKPEKVEVWSASGNREFERSVTLELTKGLYRLNMIRGWSSGGRGYAWITEIISQPESCFLYESVTFPATLRIERDCKVYGTLETDLSSSFRAQTRSWALSITKESDMLPPVPNADGWSERGPGFTRRPLDLVFEPGIYRISATGSQDVKSIYLVERPFCLSDRLLALPTQIRATERCVIKAKLSFHNHLWDETRPWSYKIEKLE